MRFSNFNKLCGETLLIAMVFFILRERERERERPYYSIFYNIPGVKDPGCS
jgi:hypothetical protein